MVKASAATRYPIPNVSAIPPAMRGCNGMRPGIVVHRAIWTHGQMLRIPIGINTLVEVGIPFTQEPEEITAPACTNEVVIFVLLMCNKKNGKMKTQAAAQISSAETHVRRAGNNLCSEEVSAPEDLAPPVIKNRHRTSQKTRKELRKDGGRSNPSKMFSHKYSQCVSVSDNRHLNHFSSPPRRTACTIQPDMQCILVKCPP